MKRHKQYIAEWKSVNDNVDKLAVTLTDFIWNDSKRFKMSFSKATNMQFIESRITVSIEDLIGENDFDFDDLNVSYIIYFFDSEESYINNFGMMPSSESDYDSKSMKIVFGSIKGELNASAYEEVYHEVEHMFSYDNGMEKRKEMYDKAIELTKSDADYEIKSVGYLLYYTFRHEQDAFANQLYGELKFNKTFLPFEDVLSSNQTYRNILNQNMIFSLAYKNRKKELDNVLSGFGYDIGSFRKRVHFGISRLKRKFKNVYIRHMIELKKRNMTVERVTQYDKLQSKLIEKLKKRYGGNINIVNESMYGKA